MLLAGCGSQEEPSRATVAAPESARPDARPVLAAFGDSLTEGLGVDPAKSYPAVLQGILDRAGYQYRVVNLGVSGETSSDGVARLSLVLAEKPALVVLEFGANDGLRGIPAEVTRGNLERMIQAFQRAGTKVVLAGMTLPPNYGPEYIREFESVYRDLAARYRVTLIPFFLEGVAPDPRYMQRDGLHPNAAGCARVAETVFNVLKPAL